jgi:hypothetical protein
MLYADYFAERTTCTRKEFQHRFRINMAPFMKLVHSARAYDPYYMMKKDIIIVLHFSSI